MTGYLAAIALALMIVVGFFGYEQGKAAGKSECAAAKAVNVDMAQKAIDLRDTRTAEARVDMLDMLRVTIPPIEIRTHETVERIRIEYKDRILTPDCAAAVDRPASVQADLDAARDSANRAVGALRLRSPVTGSTGPGMAWDREVGSRHDGFVRGSSNAAERIEPVLGWLAGVWSYPVAM